MHFRNIVGSHVAVLLRFTAVPALLACLILAAPALSDEPVDEPAAPEFTCADFTYQGDAQDALDDTTDQATIDELDPDGDGIACEDLPDEPAPKPRPKPRAKTLTKGSAVHATGTALKEKLGGKFASRAHYVVHCKRLGRTRFRCRAAWDHDGRWKATVTVRQRLSHGRSRLTWKTSSIVKPKPKPKPKPAPGSSSPSGGCDPNYAGACLDPNASDYDCAGGSGDGPLYTGPVTVVGNDHYGLDSDGDGQGCETS